MDDPVGTGFGLVVGAVIAIAVLVVGGFLAVLLIMAGLMLASH
jgi:hypothetical protein